MGILVMAWGIVSQTRICPWGSVKLGISGVIGFSSNS
jgi:hypothetical protein